MFLVISDYGWTWAKATLRTAQLPAMKRSSRFLFGNLGSDYIDFLSSVVPADKPLVKPEGTGAYAEQNLLQFFLLPRGIPACPCRGAGDTSDACAECLLAPSHYVPALGGFPEASLIENDKELVEFSSDSAWFGGVYVPQNADNSRSPSPEPNTVLSWFLAGGRSLLTYGLIYLAGLAVVSPFLYREARGWALSIAFPVGTGLITWLVFLFAWLGIPLTAWTYLVAFGLLASPLILWILKGARNGVRPFLQLGSSRPVLPRVKGNWLAAFVIVALILLLSLSLTISIGRAYSLFDGIANWALKGYAIAYEGSIFAGRNWGGHALEYPQNLHLQIALFRFMDGDTLPGSKILFSLYFTSLIGGCYLFWRAFGTDRNLALLGGLILATVPLIFIHSTIGFANLPMSVYLVLGILLGLDGIRESSVKKQILASILLGLAAWTRLEAAAYSFILALALVIVGRIVLREKPTTSAILAPMAVIGVPWLLFYSIYGAGASPSFKGLELFTQSAVSAGTIEYSSLGLIIRQLGIEAVNFTEWGVTLPLFTLAFAIGLLRTPSSRRPIFYSMLLISVVMLLSIVAVHYVVGFLFPDQLESDLAINFDRHLIPIATMMMVTAVLGFRDERDLDFATPRLGAD